MPNDPMRAQTPGQALAGQPPQGAPAGQAPSSSAPQSPAQQPQQPAPTPQQIVAARHHDIGKAASFLFGVQRDPSTGEPIKQRPGDVFKSLLMGAMLGSALAPDSTAKGGSVGGFLSGVGRGASGVEQQNYARKQEAQKQAQEREKLTLDQGRAQDEHMLHQATVAHLTAETASFHHQQEFHDQEALDKKNAAARQYMQSLRDAGGRPVLIPINGRVPANGEYSAPDIAAAYMKDPSILQGGPDVVRHFIDVHNNAELEYVQGKGWVNEDGDPVDMSKSTVVRAYDVPENNYRTPVRHSGKELNTIAGYQLVPKEQEDRSFSVPMDAVTGLYGQNLKNMNTEAQTKQRLAAANKTSKTATQATKRGTPAQFAAVESKKAAALAKAETGYQRGDLDADQLTQAKAATQKSYEDEVRALGGSVTQPTRTASNPSTPTKGDTQTHAGFNYTFDGRQWVKGQAAR